MAGYNTHSFVLQVPESEVTRERQVRRPAPTRGNAVVGVWSTTERKRISVLGKGRKRQAPPLAARSAASATR